jgi:hypothetical protein
MLFTKGTAVIVVFYNCGMPPYVATPTTLTNDPSWSDATVTSAPFIVPNIKSLLRYWPMTFTVSYELQEVFMPT